VHPNAEFGRAADLQPILSDRVNIPFRDIVGMDFNIVEQRQMGANHASERSASDNANLHRHIRMAEHSARSRAASTGVELERETIASPPS
jgi:hypothetical protein